MRPRQALIVAGSFLLGCHSLMNLGDKSQTQPVSEITHGSGLLESEHAAEPTLKKNDRNTLTIPAIGEEHRDQSAKAPTITEETSPETDRGKASEGVLQPLLIRMHYAELLIGHHREEEGRFEFERLIGEAEEMSPLPLRQLIHSHSKLMELGIAGEDDYAEHLHRGIGLYYLAKQSHELGQTNGRLNVESLLCQAAGELSLARLQKPNEARPCLFLYHVWVQLEQGRPAQRSLRDAGKNCSFSYLTPSERRHLYLALSFKNKEPISKR